MGCESIPTIVGTDTYTGVKSGTIYSITLPKKYIKI